MFRCNLIVPPLRYAMEWMDMGLYRKIVSMMASALRYTELHLGSVFLEHDVINPSRDLSQSKGRGAGQKGVGESSTST